MKRPKLAAAQITRAVRAENGAVDLTVTAASGTTQEITLSPLAASQLTEVLLSQAAMTDSSAPIQAFRVQGIAVHLAGDGGAIVEAFLRQNQAIRLGLAEPLATALRRKLDPNDPLEDEFPGTSPVH